MEHIIGIDIGSEVSSVVAMKGNGRILLQTRISTTEKNLRELVKSIKRPRTVVFEECGQAAWLFSFLEPISDDVFVCNPKKKQSLSGHAKNDDKDAYNLADKLRTNQLSRVWHGGKSLQKLRESLREYQSLTRESTVLKNRIKAVFRNRGIKVGKKAYNPLTRIEAMNLLSENFRKNRVKKLGAILDVVTKARAESRKELIKTAKTTSMYKSLLSIPGIGEVHAATIIGEVGTPLRFRTRQQFWSYCGFAVITHETGQYEVGENGQIYKKKRPTRTRGLVWEYNRHLKFTFKHCAFTLSHTHWKEKYQRLLRAGVYPANAQLTLARKVSAIALRLMKSGGEYDETLALTRK